MGSPIWTLHEDRNTVFLTALLVHYYVFMIHIVSISFVMKQQRMYN